jgi:hypothetical protein
LFFSPFFFFSSSPPSHFFWSSTCARRAHAEPPATKTPGPAGAGTRPQPANSKPTRKTAKRNALHQAVGQMPGLPPKSANRRARENKQLKKEKSAPHGTRTLARRCFGSRQSSSPPA